jgi:type IV pilus assembly protein PilO
MNLSDLNDLDFSNIGDWPSAAKTGLIIIICLLIAGGWYYYDIREQHATQTRYEKQEQKLREQFIQKHNKVVNLNLYKKQLASMEEAFGIMLQQLPDKSEIADLLIDVSQTGLGAGLEFELFQPLGESTKDFYVELPIKMRVVGNYHQFGEFISGLASMPRILTIHDIEISGGSGRTENPNGDLLKMSVTAKTYRYIGEGDQEDEQ